MPKRKASNALNLASVWLDEAQSETSLLQLFTSHGVEKKYKSGEQPLICAGQKVESIFLVLDGALAVSRSGKNGPTLAKLGAGSLAGELSFLTGEPPIVTVAVAGGSARIAELKITALQKLLKDEPGTAGLLYACLARELAKKVGGMNTAIKAHTHASGPHALASDSALLAAAGGAADASMDVATLRIRFGLDELSPPPELLGTASCVCAVERHSVSGGEGQPSQVYLFSSHVCVEQGAFGLTHRFAVDLADVLAVLRQTAEGVPATSSATAAPPRAKKAAAAANGQKAAAAKQADAALTSGMSVAVQCRSLSLTLTGLQAALVEPLCLSIEAARLDALDNSALRHKSGGGEEQQESGAGKRVWAAGASPRGEAAGKSKAGGAMAGKGKAGGGKAGGGKVGGGKAGAAGGKKGTVAEARVAETLVAPELQELMRHTDDSIESAKATPRWQLAGGPLSSEQWSQLLGAADHLQCTKGDVVLAEGEESRALYTLVTGQLLVEETVDGLTRAVVVGRLNPGDLFGERTLLLGGGAGASVVAASEEVVVLRLSSERLSHLFCEVRRSLLP